MKIILAILSLCLAAAFYFISALIDRWYEDHHKLKALQKEMEVLMGEINELYILNQKNNQNVEVCANATMHIRNDIGRLGFRVQKLERKGKDE